MHFSASRRRESKAVAMTPNFNALVNSVMAMEQEQEKHEELHLQGALMPEPRKRFLKAVFSVVRMLKQSKVKHEAEMARQRLFCRRPSLVRGASKIYEGQPPHNTRVNSSLGDDYFYNQYHNLSRDSPRESITSLPVREGRPQTQCFYAPSPVATWNHSRPGQYLAYARRGSVASDVDPSSTDIRSLRRNSTRPVRGRRGSNWADCGLPEKPRFCATLSPEAKYCMMKGYEDVLDRKLVEVFPGRHVLRKRPTERRITLNITPQLTQPPVNGDHGRQRSSPSDKDQRAKTAVDIDHGVADSQLRLTYMFERAMDILDDVKQSKGDMVTSPRRCERPRTTQPIRTFKAWSVGWKKEFVVPSDEGGDTVGGHSGVTRSS